MKSRTTRSFRRAFKRLPAEIQDRAREAYRMFQSDPSHPGLQFKKIPPFDAIYSARVSRDYRAVCTLADDVAIWFFIGSHADYDRLLSTL